MRLFSAGEGFMNLYMAGECEGASEKLCCDNGLLNRLVTFAYKNGGPMKWWVTERDSSLTPVGSHVFLDCGAFTAHTQGIEIDVVEYAEFIEQHQSVIDVYAALDVIGNVESTKKNLDVMESRGLRPMPTFHRGSLWSELERLCERYDSLALGGIASEHVGRSLLREWLDGCFAIIKRYWPKHVDGFGIGAQWALERYPFFSADSTNVIIGGGMGRVLRWDSGKLSASHWSRHARDRLDGSVVDTVSSGSAYVERVCANCRAMVVFEKHVTKLWTNRGVKWDG